MSELVLVHIHKIVQSRSYTMITLGTDEKKFAICTEPQVGHYLQLRIAHARPIRPKTFDLVERIFAELEVKVIQVVINGVQDTTYFAKIFLEQPKGSYQQILEIDARPSDGIILTLVHKTPLFCTREVLNKTIAIE